MGRMRSFNNAICHSVLDTESSKFSLYSIAGILDTDFCWYGGNVNKHPRRIRQKFEKI